MKIRWASTRLATMSAALACSVFASPAVQISSAGGFPSARRAAVFWLGVRDPVPLRSVHDVLIEAASGFLRARDVIPYVPHLTLARLDPPKRITTEVDALADVRLGGAWTAEELVLMESETHHSGSIYRTIARLPLG